MVSTVTLLSMRMAALLDVYKRQSMTSAMRFAEAVACESITNILLTDIIAFKIDVYKRQALRRRA